MAFQLSEGLPEDIPQIAKIHIDAFANDDQWRPLMRDVTREDYYQWLVEFSKIQMPLPDKMLFKVTEVATEWFTT